MLLKRLVRKHLLANRLALLGAVIFLGSTASALALEVPAVVAVGQTSLGDILVDQKGMTLYTFDKDQRGESRCYRKCAETWPPLLARAEDAPIGDFTIIERRDDTLQWAYRNRPLYTWHKDKVPGDVTGQGVRDTWYVIRP